MVSVFLELIIIVTIIITFIFINKIIVINLYQFGLKIVQSKKAIRLDKANASKKVKNQRKVLTNLTSTNK